MDRYHTSFTLEEFLEYVSTLGRELVVKSKSEIVERLKNISIYFPDYYATPNEFFGFLVLYHSKDSIEEIIMRYWPLLIMYDNSFFEEYISYGRKGSIGEKFRMFLDSFKETSIIPQDVFVASAKSNFEIMEKK